MEEHCHVARGRVERIHSSFSLFWLSVPGPVASAYLSDLSTEELILTPDNGTIECHIAGIHYITHARSRFTVLQEVFSKNVPKYLLWTECLKFLKYKIINMYLWLFKLSNVLLRLLSVEGLKDTALILKEMWSLYCIKRGHSKISYPALSIYTVTILQKCHCL